MADYFSQIAASYVPAVSLGAWGAAAYAITFWQPDNTPVNIVDKDDKKITEAPPVIPGVKSSVESSVKSSVPVVTKNKIDLPPGLDLTKYRIQDLNADRSFIRAFYFIRFQKDPSDQQLNTFVKTDIIDTFNSYKIDKIQRIFNVMHYCGKNEKAPYIAFCIIRAAAFTLMNKTKQITIEDLLKVSQVSDKMFRFLKTTQPNVSRLLEIIKEIKEKNGSFLTLKVDEQQELVDQYALTSTTKQPDNSALQLFQSLSALISDKQKLLDFLVECLKYECKNLTVNGSPHMTNDLNYRTFIKSLANNNSKSKGEVNFPYRCGVGDMLVDAGTNVCLTYIKGEDKEHYNYGCDDRNVVYPNNYIIYMHKNHHCVLLIPNKPAQPKKAFVTSAATATATATGSKSKVVPTTDSCKKYEDEYFSKGGRKRKQKRVTKRRRRSNRKSGRKGTKRI